MFELTTGIGIVAVSLGSGLLLGWLVWGTRADDRPAARPENAPDRSAPREDASLGTGASATRPVADLAAAQEVDRLRRARRRSESSLQTARRANDELLGRLSASRRELEHLDEQHLLARADALELGAQLRHRTAQLRLAEATLAAAGRTRGAPAQHERRTVGEPLVVLDGAPQPLRIPTLDPDLTTTAN